MAVWAQVIAGIVGMVVLILRDYYDRAPERKEEARDEATEKGRADIASHNHPDVQRRLLEILRDGDTTGGKN